MKRLDFAVLVAWITISLVLAIMAFALGGVDFGVYYAAARVVVKGGNPYIYQQLMGEIVSATGKLNNPYYYAPWFTWAVIPFSLLPFQIARALWAAANFLFWLFGLFNLGKLISWPPTGWQRWGIYTLVTILFAWSTWGFDQVGILIFFMFTIALLAIDRGQWAQAGLWLALLLFKPNITALPVAVLAAWLLVRGRWRPVVFAGVIVAIMIGISLAVSPGWYHALFEPDKLSGLSHTLNDSGGNNVLRFNTTLTDWLAAYDITGNLVVSLHVAVAIVGVIAVILIGLRSNSIIEVAAVSLLVEFAITPYALFYDYPSLVVTLFHVNALPLHKPLADWGRVVLNIFIMLSLFIGDTISFRYWIVIALALLLALTRIARKPDTASGLALVQE